VLFQSGAVTIWQGFADRVFVASQVAQFRCVIGGQPGSPTVTQTGLAILAGCPLPESMYFTVPITVVGELYTFAGNDSITGVVVDYEET
jgi:hypothetical protein